MLVYLAFSRFTSVLSLWRACLNWSCFKSDQQNALSTLYKIEKTHGGIYTLPPPQLNHDVTVGVKTRFSADQIIPGGLCQITHTLYARHAFKYIQILLGQWNCSLSHGKVESLGKKSMVTRCPSCEEIVCTEIRSARSEAMWLLCCLLSMVG